MFDLFRGLKETIDVAKFRFNKSFHLIGAEEFLKDLFNDKNVIGGFAPLAGLGPGNCTGVKFTHMTSSVLNMSYFDIFNELKICSDDGYIRQDYEEQVEDIMLADKLRKVMLWEDCEEDEDIANYEKIHEDKYQKEFIFSNIWFFNNFKSRLSYSAIYLYNILNEIHFRNFGFLSR